MSSQPFTCPMGGHLAIPQNGISYTNEPPMSSHLPSKATFPVSQGWLLIAGSTAVYLELYFQTKYLQILFKHSFHSH